MNSVKTFFAAAAFGAAVLGAPFAATESHATDKAKPGMVMAGDLHVSQPWTRAMLPGQKVGGGFVIIENKGADDDRLLSVSSPVTDRVEVHEMAVVDDVMRMRPLPDGLAILAGATVELKPGGYHLMFMGVEDAFEEGDMVPVVLSFEKAGDVELMLSVMPAGTKAMDHGKMDHGHKTN
ncbi:copper chaperone PCu(A)C [Nitratireductor sp. XY-223]|uniref:copper chaperone PCu(A)C n=1 Tax=Nitratireductor sp. XY-223 TaxID=2561926 RepID=UPI0010AA7B8C|nr:copper chaperone PCu(A)C [Nitratireductor sp. XY-223]